MAATLSALHIVRSAVPCRLGVLLVTTSVTTADHLYGVKLCLPKRPLSTSENKNERVRDKVRSGDGWILA